MTERRWTIDEIKTAYVKSHARLDAVQDLCDALAALPEPAATLPTRKDLLYGRLDGWFNEPLFGEKSPDDLTDPTLIDRTAAALAKTDEIAEEVRQLLILDA